MANLRCLNDSEPYARLHRARQRLSRYGRYALVPFGAVCFIELVIFRNAKSDLWAIPFLLSVAWAVFIAAWNLILDIRIMSIRCPECRQKFGGGAECFYCDLPRHSA